MAHETRFDRFRRWINRSARARLIALFIFTLAVGTVYYRIAEGWSWIDSIYFSVVTLTTIGYGDITPTRDISKLFTIGYIFTGLGIAAAFISEIARSRLNVRDIDAEREARQGRRQPPGTSDS